MWRSTQLVVVVAFTQGLGVHRFSICLVRVNWYGWLLSSYLISILFSFYDPKFKLLLRLLTIVMISRLKMMYFEPFDVLYLDFILLTCIIRQPVRLVGLVVLFSSGADFRCGWWVWLILSGELILKCGFLFFFFEWFFA